MSFSPDGQWWWDGEKWVPASQAPPQRPASPPPQSRRSRKPALVGGIVVLVLLLGLCTAALAGSGSNSQKSQAKASPSVHATPTHATTAPPAVAAVTPNPAGTCTPAPCANHDYGQIVYVGGIIWNAQVVGPLTLQPEAGNVFVTMNLTFENRVKQELHANPTEFVLQDSTDIKHTWKPLSLSSSCPTWDPVNLAQGGKFGPKCVSFEATQASDPHGLTLVWSPAFGYDYKIKLG